MRKNVASQVVAAQLVSKTDGSNITTGPTTCYVLGDGGTQTLGQTGSPSGECVHEGNGLWTYNPLQTETNYDHVVFTFVNASAITTSIQIYTSFPQTGDNFARLGAPAGASVSADIAAAKVDTAAIKVQTDKMTFTVANHLDVNTLKWNGGTIPAVNVTGVPLVDLKYTLGTISPATAGSVRADAVTGAVGSVTGNVGGNVTGSVGSVAAGGIAAASFAAGAIDAAAIATDAIDADAIKTDAVTEIQTGLATAAALATVGGNVTSIKTTTDLLQSMLEVGAGSPTYYRFTVGALELAPIGGAAPSAATIADAVWDEARAGHVAGGSFGEGVASVQGNVTGSAASVTADVGITQTGADKVWSTAARLLTAGTNIVLAKGVGVTGFNDLDAAGMRAAVGLGSANLDTQLAAIDDYIDTEVAAGLAILAKLNTTLESVGSPTDYVFTTRALAQAPSGGSAPSAIAIADEVQTRTIAAVTLVATATNLTNAPTNGDLTATMKASVTTAATAATPALSTAGNAAVADKLLGRNLAAGSDGGRIVKDALRSLRNKTSISAGILTVCEEDDSTPAWTAAVTTTPGDPLSAIDPT